MRMPAIPFAILLLMAAGLTPVAEAQWPKIQLAEYAAGFISPVQITNAADGSGRLFVVEQPGSIKMIVGGTVQAASFLDITDRVLFSGERGLLSVAFPPNFAAKRYFYVYYTDLNGNNQVSRFSLSVNPNVADPASEIKILNISHPVFANHNGGQLAFGPNGFLYIGIGDGGGAGDPNNNAQNPASLLGKMLRIDVETAGCVVNPAATPNYCIPSSNPFVSSPGTLAEIWATGLRNPWRYSFDRATGDLYIGDVGQATREEVDFQPFNSTGGENYGWRILEGSLCFNPPVGCVMPPAYSPPVVEYDHGLNNSIGCAIIGGSVYRGANPSLVLLQGAYFYGDLCTGNIWGYRKATAENILLLTTPFQITSFGEDESGEIYVTNYSTGTIYRIEPIATGSYGIGVFRGGEWFVDININGVWNGCTVDACYAFGLPSDQPIMGDWNGDGKKKIGVKRGSQWYLDFNGNGRWDGCGTTPDTDRCYTFGFPSDIPVAGNWDGSLNKADKIGVFRDGQWFLDFNGDGIWNGCGSTSVTDRCFAFGLPTDMPVVGDWNGDGISKIGVFRSGNWYLDYPGTGTWVGCGAPGITSQDSCIAFGLAGDIPVVGNWNGSADGRPKIGVFRSGNWYLDYPGTGTWVGCGAPIITSEDSCITFGLAGDVPIVGNW